MKSKKAPTPAPDDLDCQACGACCCNTQQNMSEGYVDYVEIGRRDRLFRRRDLLKRYAVENAAGTLHLRLVGSQQRCVALKGPLGQKVSCALYALRPEPCRRVKAGNAECLKARQERGILEIDPVH